MILTKPDYAIFLKHPNKEATRGLRLRLDNQRSRNLRDAEKNRGKQTCANCGGTYPHFRVYPAQGKDRKSCGKTGHFTYNQITHNKGLRLEKQTIKFIPMDHYAHYQ